MYLRLHPLLLVICFVFISGAGLNLTQAQTLAFPGAEGFGKYSSGGRGGKVLTVSNLSDSVTTSLPGSLRWALAQKGPRTVVFAVSGTISLNAPLKINHGDLTIAGQTAPGDGICIKNFSTNIDADNVIIRFIRFRCGNEKPATDGQDAINGRRHKNIIIDHCSMSWSVDETASFYDNQNFTMQWCIISESLYKSGHTKGEHGYGGIWGGMGASFHHNLFAHNTSRNPRFCGARYHKNLEAQEVVDFRNNVIFNWGFNSSYGGEGGWHNLINNYYKPGPATKKHRDRILNPDGQTSKWFVDGNFIEGNTEISRANWQGGVQDADTTLEYIRVDSVFTCTPVKTQHAVDAYVLVLAKAGAILPKQDNVDARVVQEATTGKCAFGDTYGKNTGIIDSPKSVGGWPVLKSGNARKDTDGDGMPDEWEKSRKLDHKSAGDAVADNNKNGYTNLEEYINELAR